MPTHKWCLRFSGACRGCACERRGTCLWAMRATHKAKKEALRVLPGTQGHVWRGDAHVGQPSEGESKNRAFDAPRVLVRSGLSHIACFCSNKSFGNQDTVATSVALRGSPPICVSIAARLRKGSSSARSALVTILPVWSARSMPLSLRADIGRNFGDGLHGSSFYPHVRDDLRLPHCTAHRRDQLKSWRRQLEVFDKQQSLPWQWRPPSRASASLIVDCFSACLGIQGPAALAEAPNVTALPCKLFNENLAPYLRTTSQQQFRQHSAKLLEPFFPRAPRLRSLSKSNTGLS